jgi:hypothetical protein
MKKIGIITACSLTLVLSAHAQPPAQYKFVPSAQQKLVPQANGLTSQFMLAEPKSGTAMITSRDKSGLAELHADWIDHIFVQEGGATMILGGKIDEPAKQAPARPAAAA